ncbi:MAG: peptidyl-prolyl cis-trans isomerase [Candidatus Handelsmanbacteria bacterium]|nr:peptidyl-prolyl cis-trans isomerase [Candidatus Handelsmanbacteria bacterium]
MMRPQRPWWWALLFSLAACAGDRAPERPVAQVGEEFIAAEEVERFAASLLPGLRSTKAGQEARLDYLQTLIDEKLLVREARAMGLDTTGALVAELEAACRLQAVKAYREARLNRRISVAEEELKTHFAAAGMARERSLSRLVVQTRAEAEQLEAALRWGSSFAALAKAHSLEKNRAAKGGYMGFINRTWAERLHIPPALFDTLSPGQPSPPLPLRGAYQLIRFDEERDADFSLYRPQIYRRLWKEKLARESRAAAEELAHQFDLMLQGDGLEILVAKQSGAQFFPPLFPWEAATPLYTFAGGQVSVGDYLAVFRQAGVRPGLGDSTEVVRAAWQLVLPDFLFAEAARREGDLDTPAFLAWKERIIIELLLKTLRQRAIGDQISVGEEEARRFYQDSPKLFSAPAELVIQEILLPDQEQALQVRRHLDEGADLASLVHLSQRPGAVENEGRLHLHSYEETAHGELVPRALGAEPGQLVGPVAAKEGYSVFRLLEKSGGQAQPFAAVREQAGATLRYQKEEELFNVLVAALREKYAAQVRLFPEALGQVRLPEAPH